MFSILKTSFKIDITYTINSFIYTLKHTPILKGFFEKDLYKSMKAKKIIRVLALICSLLRMITSKFIYLGFIYGVLSILFPKVDGVLFAHVFFFFTCIGMFINDTILSVGRKKYYSIITMGMDAKKYTLAYFLLNLFTTFTFNLLGLSIFFIAIFNTNFILPFILSSLVVLLKIIGEALNICFYRKTDTLLLSRNSIYFLILITGCLLALGLPYLHVCLSLSMYYALFIITLAFSIICIIYILRIEDYKKMYKKINTIRAIMNSENRDAYNKQMAIEIRKKDYKINEKKLIGKTGYDYFNTIFFLRHRVILSSSAHIYATFALILFLLMIVIIIGEPSYKETVLNVITNHFSWIILIMYFVNRGSIITQAMFYNCDRSMLSFNFYREPKVILNVFKERLKTVVRVNLLPAIVIGIGVVGTLLICTETFMLSYFAVLLCIIMLSVFFSVHYLVIYYLLQPYNINMEMKSISFSLVSFLTYFFCYLCKDIHLSFSWFSLIVTAFTMLYVVTSLVVIYKKAPDTFKLK